MQSSDKKVLRVLKGEVLNRPPLWLMRQAGRYLPEYREIRSTTSSFIEFCFSPQKAAEVTLQPIRRFGFDAAILFSDILVVPEALGQPVTFETGEGPRLPPIEDPSGLSRLKSEIDLKTLSPVFETIDRVKSSLSGETTFLGFCGAPWTVASYMIAGRGTPDQGPARMFAYRHPEAFAGLIKLLVDSSIEYLVYQFQAGVDAVQIFDSWSGVLPTEEFDQWCFRPLQEIVDGVRKRVPHAPVIAFPRAATSHLGRVAEVNGVAAVGLDTSTDTGFARKVIGARLATQGNLDPLALVSGGVALERSARYILETTRGTPHIFNLGHGILPHTPIENVEKLAKLVREF
jgi:uroporphyrinogen decarboxylase